MVAFSGSGGVSGSRDSGVCQSRVLNNEERRSGMRKGCQKDQSEEEKGRPNRTERKSRKNQWESGRMRCGPSDQSLKSDP